MLWSSYYPNHTDLIPAVGDLVTYCDLTYPYTVIAREVVNGNVLLSLQDGDTVIRRERLEVLNWYPRVGDACGVSKQAYCDWQSSLNGKSRIEQQIPGWAYKVVTLIHVAGDMATVQDKGGVEYTVPIWCLKVEPKAPKDDDEQATMTVGQLSLLIA